MKQYRLLVAIVLFFTLSFSQASLAGDFMSDMSDMADILDSTSSLLNALDSWDYDEQSEDSQNKPVYNGPLVNVQIAGKTVKIRQDFKEAMDRYEAFFMEYIDCINDEHVDFAKMASMLTEYTIMLESLEEVDNADLTDAEAAYYLEVSTRINQMLILSDQ